MFAIPMRYSQVCELYAKSCDPYAMFCGSEAHVSRDYPDAGGGDSAESDSDTSVVGVGSVLKNKVKAKRLTKADGS